MTRSATDNSKTTEPIPSAIMSWRSNSMYSSNRLLQLKAKKKELEKELGLVKSKINHKKEMEKTKERPSSQANIITQIDDQREQLRLIKSKNLPLRKVELLQTISIKKPTPVRDQEFLQKQRKHQAKMRIQKLEKSVEKMKIVQCNPPKAGAFMKHHITQTRFPFAYTRGEIPIRLIHQSGGNGIAWRKPWRELSLEIYLPLFLDGIRELEDPYKILAREGLMDLLKKLRSEPRNVHEIVPLLIPPLREAFYTRHLEIVCVAMKAIQMLLVIVGVGEKLTPHLQQFLQFMNMYRLKRVNIGDHIFYGQGKQSDVGELATETLEMMERTGGAETYAAIKKVIPTYESCVMNISSRPVTEADEEYDLRGSA